MLYTISYAYNFNSSVEFGKSHFGIQLGWDGKLGYDSVSILTIFMTREESKGGKGTQADMLFYTLFIFIGFFFWMCVDCGVESLN